MREKIYSILNKIYATLLFVSFFAGLLPIVPFAIALIVGGSTGEAISTFLYNDYYPWVIAAASVSVAFGWVALYFLKGNKSQKEEKNKVSEPKAEASVKSEEKE